MRPFSVRVKLFWDEFEIRNIFEEKMISPVIIRSLLIGIACGFIYGLLFVGEKRRVYLRISRQEENFKLTPKKAFSFSGGVLIRYLILIGVVFLIVSRYKVSLLAFAVSFILSFWVYIVLAMSVRFRK